jgi:murein DD-endopeptidase MepM/ murein hydrolase activator NlpD
MSPPHREPTTVAAARCRLAALMLVAGVILALGPGSAALAEWVARAAETASPAPPPAPQSPGPGSLGPGPPGPGPPGPGPPEPGPPEPGPPEPGSAAPGPPEPGSAEPGSTVWAPPDPERVPPLRMPLAGPIVRGFEVPAGTYGPGHRGVDVGGRTGEAVRAPAGGRVGFAGPVAGRTWVSLLVAPGVMATVGPLLDVRVTAGQRVRALAPVGRLGPGHGPAHEPGHGPAHGPGHGMRLHLSLRVDGVYVDPLPYLLDRPRPRLAPLLRPGGLAAPEPGPG